MGMHPMTSAALATERVKDRQRQADARRVAAGVPRRAAHGTRSLWGRLAAAVVAWGRPLPGWGEELESDVVGIAERQP
jgi:hypothetical protein